MTLSAVWGVQSCFRTYKYSVRLKRCNSPRGLYLEARYKHLVSKSIVYIPLYGGGKEELYTGRKKNIFGSTCTSHFLIYLFSCPNG